MFFFKQQPKNRRLGREYVLDVKLRSSQVRAARMRKLAIGGGILLAAACSVFLVYRGGAWMLDRFVYENPSFSIQQVDLQTDGVIAADSLKRWAGVRPGQNLLALDLATVKRNLEAVPFVETASVERILPHTLRVRVTEREPIAQINVPRPRASGLLEPLPFNLDAAGYVLPQLDARDRAVPANPAAEQLPLLSGLKQAEPLPGRVLDFPQVRAALQLLQCFDRSHMAGCVELKRVDISSPEVLVATTGQGSEITFGLTDVEQQLRRWREIHEMGQKMSKAIATLDLAVSNNIPARWLEASALPPAPPRLPKAYRGRKKHV